MNIRFAAMLVIVALDIAPTITADEIRVAVAANFADAMNSLVSCFEEQSGHTVVPVFGSTGKHYAQIVNGAPFVVFLAADVERPRLLEEQGKAVPGSRLTYAVGRLVLWSAKEGLVDPAGKILESGSFHHLAIASPELAPYGAAAEQTLRALGQWDRLAPRLVRGETISQAYQYVRTGNADLGFVALSQLSRPGEPATGSSWLVPLDLHRPIEQQAVLLADSPAARAFLEFVGGDEAAEIIRGYGYGVPRAEAGKP